MTADLTTNETIEGAPAGLILFGRDDRRRAHASCFGTAEVAAAERAARLMGMHVLPISNDDHRALAKELPAGRIFEASGKAFVPYCRTGLFDRLVAVAGVPDTAMPRAAAPKAASALPDSVAADGGGDGPGGADGPAKPPFDWADIGIGSLVLATTGPMEGWFEAIVRFTKADDKFVLQWRDWPLEPEIARHRKELALLHPGAMTEKGTA